VTCEHTKPSSLFSVSRVVLASRGTVEAYCSLFCRTDIPPSPLPTVGESDIPDWHSEGISFVSALDLAMV
jgi:hypothetical protein